MTQETFDSWFGTPAPATVKLTPKGGVYTVDLAKNYCTCPAWRFQHAPASERSCKHLDEVRAQAAG